MAEAGLVNSTHEGKERRLCKTAITDDIKMSLVTRASSSAAVSTLCNVEEKYSKRVE